jgi:transposase-like protein
MERALEEDAASNGARVLKRLHYPLDMVLICMRWSVAYPLSLREMLSAMHASLGAWYASQHHAWFC